MSAETGLEQELAFMSLALELAEKAADLGEIPVGAVVVFEGKVIGQGFNCPIGTSDPTAHAEIQALRQAAVHCRNYRLPGCDLYVTIEPCTMCAGAVLHSRIDRLIYGATEPKAGAVCSRGSILSQPWCNHRVQVSGGLLADKSQQLLRDFFKRRRECRQADKKR